MKNKLFTICMILILVFAISAELAYADTSSTTTEPAQIRFMERPLPTDLDYWFPGIEPTLYTQKLIQSTKDVPTTGVGYCALWVSYVYQHAGLGFTGGNACDMWRDFCISNNSDDIQEGMIIAVQSSKTSELGRIYGHCGILSRNPAYTGPDVQEQIQKLQRKSTYFSQLSDKETRSDSRRSIAGNIRKTLSKIAKLQESDTDYYYQLGNIKIPVDQNGNEKWIVTDSTTEIHSSSLSQWITQFDAGQTVAWGWGHKRTGSMAWTGDIPETVAFVYHEQEATEEDLKSESEEEVPTEPETTTKEEPETKAKKKDKQKEKETEPETKKPKETETQTETTTTEPETLAEPVSLPEETAPTTRETESIPETTTEPVTVSEPETSAEPECQVEPAGEPESVTEPEIVSTTEEPASETPAETVAPTTEVYIEPETSETFVAEPEPIQEPVSVPEPVSVAEPEIVVETAPVIEPEITPEVPVISETEFTAFLDVPDITAESASIELSN